MPTTSESNDFELQDVPHRLPLQAHAEDVITLNNDNEDSAGYSLPPTDGGKVAWRMLWAAFVFEALLWGFPLSYGIFQNYYSGIPEFQDSAFISVIGTIASGMSYLGAPIMIDIIKRYPKYRKAMIWFGWPICLLSLVAGSFARSLGALIFTQGVMYGAGFITFYYPILSMLNEYWITRKGMAYGLMCSASGVSGAVFPFAIETSLSKYGYPTTLRAIAIGLFVLTGPLIPLFNARLPVSESTATPKTNWNFLKSKLFWVYSASNLMMGMGYFFPSLYIPLYVTSNGMTATQGAILLALMSVSQVIGQLTFGYLSDSKIPLNSLVGSTTLVAGVAVYACWGVAHTFWVLAVFSLIFGFFGAGYTALWGRMGTAVDSEPTTAFAVFGLLCVGKGIGNILTGPVSGLLIQKAVDVHSYGAARFEAIVLFSGTCLTLGAVIVPLCYVRKPDRLRK